ncbi:CbtA family protein [Aliikangiella sp. IMCC44359]|uniref:CbtA family protein n=1 Tax=Aliikangiella sp. IMCC44359 TaxID=3459125 RepID=UPI00403ADA3F
MLFRRIVLHTLWIGVATGLLLSLVQHFMLAPIIYAAESFEVNTLAGGSAHQHISLVSNEPALTKQYFLANQTVDDMASNDHHSPDAWSPENGSERLFYTIISNIFASMGFSLILLALMAQLQVQGRTQLSIAKGILWGGAGFIAFFAAPSIGLPPEIPGIEAAALENRQGWWVLTVILTVVGIMVLTYAPKPFKLFGLLSIALPFIIGAPRHIGKEFSQADPQVVSLLEQLHQQFIIVSSLTNFIFWIILGIMCAWAIKNKVLNGFMVNESATI